MFDKTSDEKKREIIKLYEQGNNFNSIVRNTGISYATVYRIVRSIYPSEKECAAFKVYGVPKNPYGLNKNIKILKESLEIGDKISVGRIQGEVVGIYKYFFAVKRKNYIECFGFADFLLSKGRIE